MLGKPQDGIWPGTFLRTCFSHLSPAPHPKHRGDMSGYAPHKVTRLAQRNPVVPWPFGVSFGEGTWVALVSLQVSGRSTANSRAGPAQGQSLLCTCAVLGLVLTQQHW